MRRRAAVLVAALLWAPSGDAAAETEEYCKIQRDGVTVCKIVERREPNPGPRGPSPEAPRREDILYWPELVTRDGQLCVVFVREVFPDASTSKRAEDAEQ